MGKITKELKILTDDVEEEPTPDFQRLSDTIVSMIKGSKPKFSVGVYGDWGTGKTTLMKLVERKLNGKSQDNKEKILKIWFNAWRYEREEKFATIALMKTIAYAMSDHEKFNKISNTILRGLKILGKDILKKFSYDTIMTDEGWKEFEEKLSKKMEFLNAIDRETIYFDGLQKIENEMDQIRKDDENYRVVVFIDDLDRCSPAKAIEVLESVKVFLDIYGFIFIMGLSENTITKLISAEYERSGIKGEDYIQKIIQVPIRIPPWNSSDIEGILENNMEKKLDKEYSKFVIDHKKIISKAVQSNPRVLKQLINNVIITLETFSGLKDGGKKIKKDVLLIIEILKSIWSPFYLELNSDSQFRTKVFELKSKQKNERSKVLKELAKKEELDPIEEKLLRIDTKLWDFLILVSKIIDKIENWDIYRRATETTEKVIPSFELRPSVLSKMAEMDRVARLKSFSELARSQPLYAYQDRTRFEPTFRQTNTVTKKDLDAKIDLLEKKLSHLSKQLSDEAKRKKR